jgi:hypothetical protein
VPNHYRATSGGAWLGDGFQPPALDVPQEDLFRRVRGLWELMSPDRRDEYWKHGKSLVAEQWKEEKRGEVPPSSEPAVKSRQRRRR